uniref:HIG1 domain-containing protein n=1 Tax=Triticum urartu TaxID=4572 RepID=A0A8R7TMK2_TRIUA
MRQYIHSVALAGDSLISPQIQAYVFSNLWRPFPARAGCLWLSGISSSIAYNWSRPNMKTSVKLIHARLHAQALTIAALGSCALVEYYDQNYGSSGPKVDKYTRHYMSHSHKD